MVAATARALSRRAASALAVVLSACGGASASPSAPPPATMDAGAPQLEIGKGELEFAPLTPGEALPYVRGSQGGFHVWVSFRMRGLDPQRVLIAVTTKVEGHPELELERRGRQSFAAEGADDADGGGHRKADNAYVYAGWPAQILHAPEHVGERVQIHVHLQDAQARIVNGDTTVVIAAP